MASIVLALDPEERIALETLRKIQSRPIEQLLDEAIKSYLRHLDLKDHSAEANRAGLHEYRLRDPGFQHAIDAFVEAEAGFEDPVEGEPMNGEFVEGQFKPAGPVQSRIRDLLGA